MINLEILSISKSGKLARCQAMKVFYGVSKIIGTGNIKISDVLQIGSIQKTKFLSCSIKTKVFNDKKISLIVLEDAIHPISAKIVHLIFENKIDEANTLIKLIIGSNENFKNDILHQVAGAYMQYLYKKFNINYESNFEALNYDDRTVYLENTSVNIEEMNLPSYFETHLQRLSDCVNTLRKKPDDIDFFDLSFVLRKENLIKIYYVDTLLKFGKFSESSIKDVLQINPKYLKRCILNLEHFAGPSIVIMAIDVYGAEIDERALIVNLIKLKIKSIQDEARSLQKQKEREEIDVYNNMLNDGMREAFNDDPSNLWNLD